MRSPSGETLGSPGFSSNGEWRLVDPELRAYAEAGSD
jgi:hypothetical protein